MGELRSKVALVAGANGLVGASLLEALLVAPDFSRVIAVTRRPIAREHPKLANRIVQFDKLEPQLGGMSCDVAFCCLGTTLREAGSREAFRRVDFDYALAFARASRAAHCERFVVITAAGAASDSRHFYLRVKGELEAALIEMGLPSLDIFQPGLLLGLRRQLRPLELAAQLLMPLANPLLFGPRKRYRAVAARTVANAMIGAARTGRKGVHRYSYPEIQTLSRSRISRTYPSPRSA